MTRTAVALAVTFASLLLADGCLCGGYAGGSDRVYQQAPDQLIVCENGGFVAMANGATTLEGFWGRATESGSGSSAAVIGTDGTTGAIDFSLYDNANGTASIPALAPGEWQELKPDAAELDHYDWYCEQLVTQSWWTNVPAAS
jgi:hypothetical protein